MGRRLLLGLLFAAVFAMPGQAHAAAPFAPCKTGGVECATVNVPLDRTGVVPGTIALHVEMLRSSGTPRGVMFLIAGGPGQGSAGSFDLSNANTAELMQFFFPGYTLVAFDNRGTGQSGLINCPGLQKSISTDVEQVAALAGACAAIIGSNRQFYATRDHAEDLDAVRVALGVDKVGLYGVSYGTKLALAYALAHPANVERLLLDSVVPVTFPDPFDRNVLQEMPDTLRAFCAGNVCRGATTDFAGDVVALANRLETKPISGKIIAPDGSTRTVRMNGEDLLSMLVDADLSPSLASEAPAAVRAARRGYNRPLLRLFDLDIRSNVLAPEDLSFGLNAATNCADGRFPWTPNTSPTERRNAINSAIARLLPGSLGPFGAWAARLGTAFYCEQWPAPSGNTPLGPGPFPNVPVLAINGGFDMRTPVANAVSVVDQFPQGKLLVVPGIGHSVLSLDPYISGCASRAVREWILGTYNAPPRAECSKRVLPLIKVMGAFPLRSKRTRSVTLATAGKALRDAEAMWFQLTDSPTARGLYGGRLVAAANAPTFTLARYSIAPGVFVSGKVSLVTLGPPTTYKGTIRVSGPAAVAGTLTISKNRLSGTLGGHRVSGTY